MLEASLATHVHKLLTGYAESSLLLCLTVRAAGGTELAFEDSLKNVTANILNEELSLYSIIGGIPDFTTMQVEYALVNPTTLDDIADTILTQDPARLSKCDTFARIISREVGNVVPVLAKLSEPGLTYVLSMTIFFTAPGL